MGLFRFCWGKIGPKTTWLTDGVKSLQSALIKGYERKKISMGSEKLCKLRNF